MINLIWARFPIYIGGIAISGVAGFISLRYMTLKHGNIPL
jgi:hypothetical protein